MKHLGIAAVLFFMSCTISFSQGQIHFSNSSAVLGRNAIVINNITGSPLVGTNYVAQLIFASDAQNLNATSALVEGVSPFRVPNTTVPGTWAGGIRNFVASVNQGDTVNLMVRVWDNNFGSYADSIVMGRGGYSAAFSYIVPTNPPSGSSLVMNNFQGFGVNLPEPSTITLGFLGLVALGIMKLRRLK